MDNINWEKLKKYYYIGCIVITLVLAVVGYIILPDMETVQQAINGRPNTAPKLLSIAIPIAFVVLGPIIAKKDARKAEMRGLMLSFLGVLIMIMTLFFN